MNHRLIPWTIDPNDESHDDAEMLRLESRRREELYLTLAQQKALAAWLGELQERGEVVSYRPGEGFVRVPRASTDTDLIRK